jgi:aldehyde dehydrogenase (NAD+)
MSKEILEYQLFMDGQWTPGESGEMMEVINPGTRRL